MKTFQEKFRDSIDMTDGSVTITEKDYKAIQLDALTSARNAVRDYPCESGSRCCCVNVQKEIMAMLTNPKEPNA